MTGGEHSSLTVDLLVASLSLSVGHDTKSSCGRALELSQDIGVQELVMLFLTCGGAASGLGVLWERGRALQQQLCCNGSRQHRQQSARTVCHAQLGPIIGQAAVQQQCRERRICDTYTVQQ